MARESDGRALQAAALRRMVQQSPPGWVQRSAAAQQVQAGVFRE
jgi:hypothetical protein